MTSTDSVEPLRIVVYSDYVCPWCYIGLHRIDRLRGELPVEVEWRGFELHPETPRGNDSNPNEASRSPATNRVGAHLMGRLGSVERARAYRDNIVALARESGIEMRMPLVVANSHRALEAAEFARANGGFETYHRALFRAYFEEGRDIGDAGVLAELARESGVDDQGLRQALADETYAAEVDRQTLEARADEILSTPTFVFEGGFRLTGAQDEAVFRSVAERLLSRRPRTNVSRET